MDKVKPLLQVSVREAKPNKMFTEEQRQDVRFLIYNRPVACAHCGRKTRSHWTLLCAFRSMAALEDMPFGGDLSHNDKSFPPLTPVCGEHALAPDIAKAEEKR